MPAAVGGSNAWFQIKNETDSWMLSSATAAAI